MNKGINEEVKGRAGMTVNKSDRNYRKFVKWYGHVDRVSRKWLAKKPVRV